MKTGIMTILIASCLPVSVFATTLWSSTDIDLLVLDGKKVSSSLLRGAGSIELDNGPHQLVLRVGKIIHLSNSEERLYVSPPLMVSFNTQLINQVNFRLPRLENKWGVNHFDTTPRFELLDGNATPIPVKSGILAITSTVKVIGYKVEVGRYNKPMKRTSLPQSAVMMVDNSMLLSGVSELDAIPSQSQVLTE